jgi:hypothetical protein
LIIPVDTQFRDASKKGLPLSAMNDQARGVLAFTTLLDTVLEMRTDTYQRKIPDIPEVETYG